MVELACRTLGATLRRWGPVVFCLAAIACTDANAPAGVTVDQLAGTWELTRAANPACLGGQTPQVYLFRVPRGDVRAGALSVVANWGTTPALPWALTGSVDLASRTADLRFWLRVLDVGAQFRGTVDGNGTMRGTLTDPVPGYRPHLVASPGCTFEATARRTATG